MAYSIDSSSDSCYPGTSVLVNKLGIQNQAQLDENETLIVGVKSLQFELAPFPEPLDFKYYKKLQRFLFDELHEWAGTVRSIELSKQRTRFCPVSEIESLAGPNGCISASWHRGPGTSWILPPLTATA